MKASLLTVLAVFVTLTQPMHAAPPAGAAPGAAAAQGVEKIVKASVAEVAKNGDKFKGVVIELTGVSGVELRDWEPGGKEVVIKGEGGAKLVGKMLEDMAKLAVKSPKIYVGYLYFDKRTSEARVGMIGNTIVTEGDRPIWK